MMALKDLLSFTSDKIAETFHHKPYDPSRDRAALMKRIAKTNEQFSSATPVKGRKMFTINHKGEVLFTSPVAIGDKTEFYFEAGKFGPFLEKLTEAVGLGEFDDQLEKQATQPGKTSTAPKARASSGGGNGWSDERRARFQASIDARKAAKDAAK